MIKRANLAIVDIYVRVKRRATLDQKRVDDIATSIGASVRSGSGASALKAAPPTGEWSPL
jgi:hypothetical protein